ncbi:MAG: sugar ABC transporter substrate-binding protein [Ruminococcus sp.]|jgi:ribose transport system substrate-binding protein
MIPYRQLSSTDIFQIVRINFRMAGTVHSCYRSIKTRIALMLFCIAMLISGCGKSSGQANSFEDVKRITFVCPITNDDTYWESAYEGMKAAARELGGIDVMMTGSDQADEEEWVRSFDSAVAAQVDGIISTGTSKALISHINKAAAEHIPVALIDTDLPESDRLCYVGLDNYELGREGIELISELSGKKAQIGVIGLSYKAENFKERLKGMEDAVKQYPQMQIVTVKTVSNAVKASEAAAKITEQYPQIDTFYCIDGTTPKGAAQFLIENHKTSDILCVGMSDDQEIVDRIRDGSLDGTISLQPYEMGYQALMNLNDYLNNEEVNEITIPDTRKVSAENIEKFAYSKGYQ